MNTTDRNLPLAKILLRQYARQLGFGCVLGLLLCALLTAIWTEQFFLRAIRSTSANLANNISDNLASGDVRGMQNLFFNAAREQDIFSATLYDRHGHAILAWANGALVDTEAIADRSLIAKPTLHLTSNRICTITPVSGQAGLLGNLKVDYHAWPLYWQMLLLLLSNAAAFLLAGCCSIALFFRQQLRTLQPLQLLTQQAQQVLDTSDYSLRVQEVPGFADLGGSFNAIIARMESWENSAHSASQLHRAAEERSHVLDNHDSLTKLPNRHYFHKLITNSIEDALGNHQHLCLMFLDLDHFKLLSERLGYDACDQILLIVAERCQALLSPGDTLCRVDADEFALVFPQQKNLESVRQLADQILHAMQAPMLLKSGSCQVSASIGIACCPLHALEQRLFLRNADLALQSAKAAGRNTWRLYDPNQTNDPDLSL